MGSNGAGLWTYRPTERPKLVIFGAGEFAEIACEYFSHDSPYEVVAFAVERDYLTRAEIDGRPVIAIDEVETRFPPVSHSAFVAVTYTKLNRVRARLFSVAKKMGYAIASYVSSRAFVWRNVSIGENVFVFENNVIQHHARIEDDVVLWSGNHVGHRSSIGAHCYISSHVVISGYCSIGEYSFIGVNATIADNVKIGRDCLIGAGAVILKDTSDDKIYRATAAEPSSVSSMRFHKIGGPH
jgi:sugar O-acyltransferase (sialic acid O-acetyltransferase NeuD family)